MGTTNKREVAKRLKEEIWKTTDPKLMVELTRQLAAISPKTTRRKRKPVEKPAERLKKNRSLREIYTGSVYDAMSDDKLVIHHLVLQIEKKQKTTGTQFANLTQAEQAAWSAEFLEGFKEAAEVD